MEYPSSLLLLLLAASVFLVRSQCPNRETVYPCTCKVDFMTEDMTVVCQREDISFSQLKSVLSQFSKKEEISSLELSYLDIGTIPSNLFEGIAVKQITILSCKLDFECSKPTLKGLEDSLQVLNIISSLRNKNIPPYLKLSHLKELKTLKLLNNDLRELHEDMFDNEMPNLNSLVLENNGIKSIRESAFENLTNVKYFTLSGNELGSLRRNMIPTSATQLMKICLDNNDLKDLSPYLFTSMPALEGVSLRNNEIKTFDRNSWGNIVDQLRIIHLENNPLQCDSGMEWLFEKKMSDKYLYGKCSGPRGKEGLSLEEFFRKGKES